MSYVPPQQGLGFDDPTNTIGLGAPAIIRGTVYLSEVTTGLTYGTGLSSGQRITNATQLQAATDAAAANNKFVEMGEGTIEISNTAGVTWQSTNYNGFVFRGSANLSRIIQFGSNAPVLLVGPTTPAATPITGVEINGLLLDYGFGVSNTSNTTFTMGGLAWCKLSGIELGGISGNAPFNAIHVGAVSGVTGFFSNSLDNIRVLSATNSLLTVTPLGSTGSVWSNCYFGNAASGGAAQTCTAPVVLGNGNSTTETVFDGCNWEWCSSNTLMNINQFNASFIGCHWEGNIMTGFDPYFFQVVRANVQIIGGATVNPVINSGNISGTARVICCFDKSWVNVIGHWMETPAPAAALNNAFILFDNNEFSTTPVANRGIVSADGIRMEGFEGFLSVDATLPRATYGDITTLHGYSSPKVFPHPKATTIHNPPTGLVIPGGSGAETTVLFDTPIAATVTIVLSALMMNGSDKGFTLNRPTGDQCEVIRDAGCTGAFSIVVKALTSGGTTIGTITTASTLQTFGFNGTTWAAI